MQNYNSKLKIKSLSFFVFTFYFLLFTLIGCGPTYPKERMGSSIVDLCKKEYGVDVEVKIVGSTVGVYIPIDGLLDKELAINPPAFKKIDDVVMSVSRVALSTDADFNFYVVIAQDPAAPELELVIIRYVEDIKRFYLMDISRMEYFDRGIIERKLTPQAQKEILLQELFERLGMEASGELIEDYFKSGYIDTIVDIGYWNGRFFLNDISMGEFLAKQAEERIRKVFLRENSLRQFGLNFVNGAYKEGIFDFRMEFNFKKDTAEAASYKSLLLKPIYGVLSKVLHGYKFEDYLYVSLFYDGEDFIFTKEDLDNLKRRKIKLEDII